MAGSGKDDEEAWGGQIEDNDAPAAGVSKEILRKARQVNPQLASQGSTTELFTKMKDAQAQGPVDKKAAAAGPAPTADFDAIFEGAKTSYKENRQRIEGEIARLQKEHAQVPQVTLETIMDALIAIDPNMTSPQTQEILKSEAAFLTLIGFSVRKVMDRKKAKRK
ncbi:MAG: hypothetical protein IT381_04405 [Deltaproteobacteria bacterium]|nr:hypothetical protein [Deltaproteobacteria bacterium]